MRTTRTRWLWWIAGLAVVSAVVWSFIPAPIAVDAATVARGRLVVTIDEDGRTRVRDRFTVSAPVSGTLTRIAYRAGARVRSGQPIAYILPATPVPIDARSRAQLEARASAAGDALRQARMRLESARANLHQADRELQRQIQLDQDRISSPQQLDAARTHRDVTTADVDSAAAGVEVAEHDVEAARAALLAVDPGRPAGNAVAIRAPTDGAVLRVLEESERTVLPGTPLIEIGDPAALEIVADLLSTDAVQVAPGTPVVIDRWGGDETLGGRVRLIEPSSFTKVSALGVEEQRVNVIIDFAGPRTDWQRLGDRFALEVRVVVWAADNVLKVPVGALFRCDTGWCVYIVTNGRAHEQPVRVGHRNDLEASIDEGLRAGDVVVLHPSERIASGTRVTVRRAP